MYYYTTRYTSPFYPRTSSADGDFLYLQETPLPLILSNFLEYSNNTRTTRNMSTITGDTGCPRCIEQGNDKTHNHLILFEDGGAYCNRCQYTTNWKEDELPIKKKKELSDEQVRELVEEFESCEFKPYNDRGLSLTTVRRFGARAGAHPTDRTKTGSYLLPIKTKNSSGSYVLSGYKVGIPVEFRKPDLPKYYCQGRVKDACLFGEELLPDQPFKKLFITESPMDAMALYQAIKQSNKGTQWADLEPNVVGLQHGTGSAIEAINKAMPKIKLADEITLVFDNDKAGQEATQKVKALIPSVKSVALPMKDPNEMLLEGKGKDLAKLAMWGAETVKIDEVVDISDIEEEVVKKPQWGKAWSWPSLTKLTYGKRVGEVLGVAGGVGVGKSEVKYKMIANDIQAEETIGVFDLEATVGRTGKAIVGSLKKLLLHKPDVEYDEEEIRAEVKRLTGKVKLYNHKGVKDWKDIKKAIRHMVVVDGCTTIYLDNMTALVAHLKASDANDELNTIMSEVASMTEELGFTFIYYAHLNSPKTGPSHERGGKVHENQLTGSRAMIKWSHYIIGLERNKDPDLPEHERNTTTVVLLKDREFGNVGKFHLFYNKDTGELTEILA